MAYLDTQHRPNLGSMGAVIVIHGALGAALVLGLSVAGVIKEDETIIGINIKRTLPPPPPEPPEPTPSGAPPRSKAVVTPIPPTPFPTSTSKVETTTLILPPQPTGQPGAGEGFGKVIPVPTPTFTPIAAKPRNDPNRWVTSEDYRGNWIRQEMVGKARFRLEIAADGRVAGCTITGSSGHPELDAATCALVTKRARFQPARGSEGEAVAGSYSNAIDWRLPE